jgi:hypothetical protein
VDAVLEGGPVLDQVQAEAGALALGPDGRVREPDLGHQVAPAELAQDPGVDLVGATAQGCEGLGPSGVGDPDVPAGALELVVDEAGAGHRFDDGHHRLMAEVVDQSRQPVAVRHDGARAGELVVRLPGVPVESFAAEVESDVQHCWASPVVVRDRPSLAYRGRPSFMPFSPAGCR